MVPVVSSRSGASRRRRVLVLSLLGASAALAVGVLARMIETESADLTNLVWNLFLAWIPFVLALVLYDAARRGARAAKLLLLGAGWLVFLPNAPYIATDVIWLGISGAAPTGTTRCWLPQPRDSACCSGSCRSSSFRSSSPNGSGASRAGRRQAACSR
jgi:hypothetical protein